MDVFKNKKMMVIFSWAMVVFWMLFIFALSAQPATESGNLSKRVTEVIIKAVGRLVSLDIETDNTKDVVSKFDHIVRKCAHGAVYFILGILTMNAFITTGVKGYRAFVFSFLFCVIYAISDEIHQLFVPGRGAQAVDVLIDSIGAFVGIGLYSLLMR